MQRAKSGQKMFAFFTGYRFLISGAIKPFVSLILSRYHSKSKQIVPANRFPTPVTANFAG